MGYMQWHSGLAFLDAYNVVSKHASLELELASYVADIIASVFLKLLF